ncbi:hypothetical protein [Roseibium sp. M-1]
MIRIGTHFTGTDTRNCTLRHGVLWTKISDNLLKILLFLAIAAIGCLALCLPATAQVPGVGDGVCVAFCDDYSYTPPQDDYSDSYGGSGGYSYQYEQMQRSNRQPGTTRKNTGKMKPSVSQRKKIKEQNRLAGLRRKSAQENKKCIEAFDSLIYTKDQIETLIKHCSAALDYCEKGRGKCKADRWNLALANAIKAKDEKRYADAVSHYDTALTLCEADDGCENVKSNRQRVAGLADLQREADRSQDRILAAATRSTPGSDETGDTGNIGLTFLDADAVVSSAKANYLLDALALGQGDWTKSIEDLEGIVRDNPDDRAARDALLYLKGLYQGQLAVSKMNNIRYRQGIDAWMDGNYDIAANHLAESYLADPDDYGALEAYGLVSGLAQTKQYLEWTGNCGKLVCPPPDPLRYPKDFASLLNSRAYELLSDVEREDLVRARSLYSDPRADPDRRAALQYVEGLAAWDDFRSRVLERASTGADMRTLTEAYIRIGSGDYQGAIDMLDPIAFQDDKAATFAYFHAMGLAEDHTPSGEVFLISDLESRLEATWRDLKQTRFDANVLIRHDPKLRPPWKVIRDRLRKEELDAFAEFLTDPFATAGEIVQAQQ